MYLPYLIPEGHEYQYDLGWLVRKIMSFETELNTAIDLKTIHYADPLQWDITTQYSPNTVVVDPKTGTAYMSKVPVPSGVQLTNTDYWVVVFNYQRIYDKIMSGVAFNDMDNLESSKDLQKYDFVWYGGDLYQAQRDIPQGSKYVPGVNIAPATIAGALAAYYGRDRTANVVNDTVNVGETQTITAKNRVLNAAEDQTVTAGNITETSANRTIHTTADYTMNIDGNFSDQINGTAQKMYGNSLNVGVAGQYTAEYQGNATETYSGERNVSVQRMNITSAEKTLPIVFPDKTVDLYNNLPDYYFSMFPGTTDDEKFLNAEKGSTIVLDKDITLSDPVVFTHRDLYIDGNGHTIYINSEISGNTQFTQNIYFNNIIFDGTGGGFFTATLSLLGLRFTNCQFVNFTHDIIVGNEMQDWRFTNCYFNYNSNWVVNAERTDGVSFIQCNIENGSMNFYKSTKFTYQLTVFACIIEGLRGTAFDITQYANMTFDSIYLESNAMNWNMQIAYCGNATFRNIHCNSAESYAHALIALKPISGTNYGNLVITSCDFGYSNGCIVQIPDGIGAGLKISIDGCSIANNTNKNPFLWTGTVQKNQIRSDFRHYEYKAYSGITNTNNTFTLTDDMLCTGHHIECVIPILITRGSEKLAEPKYNIVYAESSTSIIFPGADETAFTAQVLIIYQ